MARIRMGRRRGRVPRKLEALAHYICYKCQDPTVLGSTKLNKILWYSDVIALQVRGEAITGETYVKQQFGPVPRHILEALKRLEKREDIVVRPSEFHGYTKKDLIALTAPDISIFKPEEISIVDDVLREVCFNHTAASISLATHDDIWKLAEIGEEIPLETAFASELAEITDDDVKWAKRKLSKIA
jgi:Protein of unknown function (DUF4065)